MEHLAVYLFAHNKNQMYIPNTSHLYGSAVQKIELSANDKAYRADVDFVKSHMKALDQSSERCEKTTEKQDTSACIVKFIEEKIGCRFSFYNSNSQKSRCNTSSQYHQLFKLTEQIQTAGATEIYEITGCLSSCERDIYHMNKPERKPVDFLSQRFEKLEIKFTLGTGT
jgi:hypothetical protein